VCIVLDPLANFRNLGGHKKEPSPSLCKIAVEWCVEIMAFPVAISVQPRREVLARAIYHLVPAHCSEPSPPSRPLGLGLHRFLVFPSPSFEQLRVELVNFSDQAFETEVLHREPLTVIG